MNEELPGWPSGFIRVKNGFYAYIDPDGGWFKSNTGIIDAGDYTVLVDSQYNEPRMKNVLRLIKEQGLPEPRIIINTHHHGDHVWANHTVHGAVVVSHMVTARLIEMAKDMDPSMFKAFFPELDFTGSRYTPPNIMYEGGVGKLNLPNGVKLSLVYIGPAHTPGDTMVVVEGEGIAYTGDLVFYKVTPFALDGYLKGWIDVTEKSLLEIDVERYVPGHGSVTDKSGVEEMLGYLRLVYEIAVEAHKKGMKPLEAALEADLGRYSEWVDRERIVGNLYRAYLELEGESPAKPVGNIASIALDMLAYRNRING